VFGGKQYAQKVPHMIIGERLRTLREEKKLSQGDIEQRTGLLRCYISRVENGHTVPAVETLEKMARALQATSLHSPENGPPNHLAHENVARRNTTQKHQGQWVLVLSHFCPNLRLCFRFARANVVPDSSKMEILPHSRGPKRFAPASPSYTPPNALDGRPEVFRTARRQRPQPVLFHPPWIVKLRRF
jgi:transcriptional regulator with XRE-family HTH domain